MSNNLTVPPSSVPLPQRTAASLCTRSGYRVSPPAARAMLNVTSIRSVGQHPASALPQRIPDTTTFPRADPGRFPVEGSGPARAHLFGRDQSVRSLLGNRGAASLALRKDCDVFLMPVHEI